MIRDTKIKGLQYLYHDGELLAIILEAEFKSEAITFFSPPALSQQLGYLPHKKGAYIKPHRHKINRREILFTQEALLIKEGRVNVHLFDRNKKEVGFEELRTGDLILLCGGGHGFEILEDTIMIEIKQGPYIGQDDKEVFG